MKNVIFGKAIENVRKYTDIKIVTREIRRNYLVSEPNFHFFGIFQVFHRNVISNRNEKNLNTYQ